jgi:hypothetical protein
MRKIRVSNGQFAKVDDQDYDFVSQWKWSYSNGYAMRGISKWKNGKEIFHKGFKMHREILSAPIGMEVDHINGDKLDNRRSNLRIVTSRINSWNRQKLNKNNKTGYRGITFRKQRGHYVIRVGQKHFGHSKTIEGAIKVYDEVTKHYHKEFAQL